METFSREYLQSLPELRRQREIKQHLDNIVNGIASQVYTTAESGKTSYLYPIQRGGVPNFFKVNHPTNEQILQAIQEKFPDCDVEYIEIKLTNGKIAEAGYKIDWS
jgi:hypothetical protein